MQKVNLTKIQSFLALQVITLPWSFDSKVPCSFTIGAQTVIFWCRGGFLEQGHFNKRFMYDIQKKDPTGKKYVVFSPRYS